MNSNPSSFPLQQSHLVNHIYVKWGKKIPGFEYCVCTVTFKVERHRGTNAHNMDTHIPDQLVTA